MRGLPNMSNSWIRTGDDWRPRTLIRQPYRWYSYTGTLYIIEHYIDCAELTCTGIWPSIVYTIVYYIDCVKLARSISPVSGPLYSIPLYTTLTVWYLRVPCIWSTVLYTIVHYIDCMVLTWSQYLALYSLYHCISHWLCGTYVLPVSGPL